jgi:uncharacterized protein (DUF58 family)
VRLIFKPVYLLYRLFAWARYRLTRRFTPAGLMALGAMIVAAMMGPDTDNNVTYQVFALLFFLLVVAVTTGWLFRGRFAAVRVLPQFGTVGNPLTYTVRLRNLSPRPQSGLVLLENLADPRPSFAEWLAVQRAEEMRLRSFRISQPRRTNPFKAAAVREAPVPAVAPGEEAEVRVELTPVRRGVLRFNGVTVARADALGLFRAFRKVSAPQSALILPRRYPLPPLALPGSLKYQDGGVALASHVGQSDEFVALRDYRYGDPLRHIHWRSWAKAGKPVVKEFEDEFFVRHALVLDTFGVAAHSEAFEEAISVAASFACSIQTQESLLDLLFVGPQSFCFTAGRGLAHADQMLEVLASVQPCRHQPFRALEHLVINHIQAVSGCVCVLLDWDDERREFVRKLRMQGLPVLVLVIRDRGQGKGFDPGPLRDDPARFRVLEVGAIEQGLAHLEMAKD